MLESSANKKTAERTAGQATSKERNKQPKFQAGVLLQWCSREVWLIEIEGGGGEMLTSDR